MATLTINREEREELRTHLDRVLDPHWDGGPTDEASGRAWMNRIRLMDQLGWEAETEQAEFEISGFDLGDDLRPMIQEFSDYTDNVYADDTRDQIRYSADESEIDPGWLPIDGTPLAEVRRRCGERVEAARQSVALMDAIRQRMHGLIREQKKAVTA